ncbi:MAG TPA: DNA/RNA non-specific endonuclease, partial [Chitinophagaceae bacterium]|nr:DNA/RNA non-specific endonuclease [Chitinophagaceae bacterium]
MRLILVLSFLCLEAFSIPRINAIAPGQSTTAQAISSISEDFESGSKSSYGPADVQLSSGSWFFNNALIGSLSSDQKNGSRSVRIKGAGSIRMNFDFQGGASTVSIKHAVFGADQGSTWVLQISTDGGNSFNQVGNTITSSSTSLQEATFAINITGNIRIAIVKTDGGTSRINIDDVVINPLASGTGTSGLDNDNMLLGNPSHATADTDNFDNYLMVKEFYTLCYNRDKGKPDWVSWHLQASDLDSVDRSNDFRADITLPVSWFHVDEKSYTGSGFDRGHNCPSADRTL